MRVLVSRKGFSLVELLTVIAIIAILASIIFPVMSMVSNKARMNKCITQLHQIGLGLQIFKQDNRRYPDILGSTVQRQGGTASGAVIPFNRAGTNPNPSAPLGLFPEYVKSSLLFHCPVSNVTDPAAWDTDPNTGWEFYPYDSYDFKRLNTTDVQQHYTRSWVIASTGTTPAAAVQARIADDTQNPPRTGDAASDYERQLKFRTPPDNTVVTWCSWHETGDMQGKAPTLYLDGHVDSMPAVDIETFKWRLLPKKE